MPRLAHPPRLPCRVAHHQRIVGHRTGHHGARTDKRILANFMATHDRRVGPNGSTLAYVSPGVLRPAVDGAAGIDDIGENHGRTEEHIIFTGDPRIYGDVVLNFDVVAQDDLG